ncbi:hypothetical protein ACSQ67_001291 [Phaseolus vulgaris]
MGASAKAGMEKTKANVEEKAERLTTRDPLEKEMATQKKDVKVNQAELDKLAARAHNAASKEAATYPTTGEHGNHTELHQTSAMPGHGTGQPTGHVTNRGLGGNI